MSKNEEEKYVVALKNDKGIVVSFPYFGVSKEEGLDAANQESYEGKAVLIEIEIMRRAIAYLDRQQAITDLYNSIQYDCKWRKYKAGVYRCTSGGVCNLNNCMLVLSSSLARRNK